jgi:hypothetical protein
MRQILSLVAASLISLIPATGHAMTILRLDTNLILYGRSCVKIWHRSVRNCRARSNTWCWRKAVAVI